MSRSKTRSPSKYRSSRRPRFTDRAAAHLVASEEPANDHDDEALEQQDDAVEVLFMLTAEQLDEFEGMLLSN